jgi:hypothetical protein
MVFPTWLTGNHTTAAGFAFPDTGTDPDEDIYGYQMVIRNGCYPPTGFVRKHNTIINLTDNVSKKTSKGP